MPAARDDYLLRLVQQVNAAIRRLRERLEGAGSGDDVDARAALGAIGRDAHDTIGTLLGPQAPLLAQLDAVSAVALVADADRVGLWITLLRLQAEAAERGATPTRAAPLAARATALERAAQVRWPAS